MASEPEVLLKKLPKDVIDKKLRYPGLATGTKVLVTGGCFVGRHVASLLKDNGCEVTCSVLGGDSGRVDPGKLAATVAGQEIVIHVGRPRSGTDEGGADEADVQVLLAACEAAKVKRFVYMGSAGVVFDGRDLKAASEDLPYVGQPAAGRPCESIARAEAAVLKANGQALAGGEAMLTCSIRAAATYGPGDDATLPGLVSLAGTTPIGDGGNIVDFCYAGNAAHALALAAERLAEQGGRGTTAAAATATAAGRAFFVTDGEPAPFRDFAGRALTVVGYRAPTGAGIPVAVAALLAAVLRVVALVLSPLVAFQPSLTAERVTAEGRSQQYDITRARRELGYAPAWTQEEALAITARASRALWNPAAKVRHVGPFAQAEVAEHCTAEDAWIIVDRKVYDVTPYLFQHPGGKALLRNAGGDSSKGMRGPQHPPQAFEILEQHYIGDLEGE